MGLAIAHIGTAAPPTVVDQDQALRLHRALACPTPEQYTWMPGMYTGTGIEARHISFAPQVVRDVLEGTRYSGSVYLPTGRPDDRGPTTGQRLAHYADLAPPLARRAADEALGGSGLHAAEITHL